MLSIVWWLGDIISGLRTPEEGWVLQFNDVFLTPNHLC
jgi:hypothetical protein